MKELLCFFYGAQVRKKAFAHSRSSSFREGGTLHRSKSTLLLKHLNDWPFTSRQRSPFFTAIAFWPWNTDVTMDVEHVSCAGHSVNYENF